MSFPTKGLYGARRLFSAAGLSAAILCLSACGGGGDGGGGGAGPMPPGPVGDVAPPSTPAALRTLGASESEVVIAWQEASDDVGVTGYELLRDDALLATLDAAARTYTDRGLAPGATHTYVVRAFDAAGNVSASSSPLQAGSTSTADSHPPATPAVPTLGSVTATSVSLSWASASDDVGVTGYRVLRDGAEIARVDGPTTRYTDTGLSASKRYTYTVLAADAAGNLSAASPALVVTTSSAPDITAPTVPSGLSASGIGAQGFTLNWNAASDNVLITQYQVQCDGGAAVSVAALSYARTGLQAATSYACQVRARDAAGNVSAWSPTLTVKTLAAADTTAPSVPTGLAASAVTANSMTLSWNAATDNVLVTQYQLQCDGGAVVTVTALSYVRTGLQAATSYSCQVRARDAAGNVSAWSSALTAKTAVAPDTTAPAVPAGLAASAVAANSITLGWNAATDNVAVSGYELQCDGGAVVAVATLSYTKTGLLAATNYSCQVRARDAAGNASSWSAALTVRTAALPDTTGPSAPTGLAAGAITANSIALSWNAATDNVGVTGYEVLRGGVKIAAPASTSYTDSGLTAATRYSYSVRAKDAAGNFSAVSAALDVTTSNTNTPASRQTQKTLLSRNGDGSQQRMRFLQYLPEDYERSATTYPLMIFLHGSGETSQNDAASADATEYARIARNGPPMLIQQGKDMCFTVAGQRSCFIVISPQSPAVDSWWSVSRVREVLDYAKANLRVDPRRIYMTGLSMGGGITWAFARGKAASPTRFYAAELAAIVPIAGADAVSAAACNMAKEALPIWAFHGTADGNVSIDRSREFVNAINGVSAAGVQCGANPTKALLTEYAGVAHDSWTRTYNPDNRFNPTTAQPDTAGVNVYEWMLSQVRPVQVDVQAGRRALSAGTYHSLGVSTAGTAVAWGSNRAGELGVGSNDAGLTYASPRALSLDDEIVAVSAGGYQSLALNRGGRVWSFGSNEAGQRGDGSAIAYASGTPVLLPGLQRVVQISSGGRHNLALTAEGQVFAWGADDNGQVGRGTAGRVAACNTTVNMGGTLADAQYQVTTPYAVSLPVRIRRISAGYCGSYALDENGEVWSWGYGDYQAANMGQGVKGVQVVGTPGKIAGLSDVIDIAGGEGCAYALKRDGTVWAWGVNRLGCVGDGTRSVRASPVMLSVTSVTAIAARSQGAYALRSDGSLWSWGESMYGSVGDGTLVAKPSLDESDRISVTAPVRIQSWTDVRSIHSGSPANHVFAVRANGSVWTWGRNKSGNLGDGQVGDADSMNTTPDDKNVGTPEQVNL